VSCRSHGRHVGPAASEQSVTLSAPAHRARSWPGAGITSPGQMIAAGRVTSYYARTGARQVAFVSFALFFSPSCTSFAIPLLQPPAHAVQRPSQDIVQSQGLIVREVNALRLPPPPRRR
jgi:hypothetical protein